MNDPQITEKVKRKLLDTIDDAPSLFVQGAITNASILLAVAAGAIIMGIIDRREKILQITKKKLHNI